MRTAPTLLLVLLASCTAVNRGPDVQTPTPELQWPFDQPAWVQTSAEAEGEPTELYAGKPKVTLSCEFLQAGWGVEDLADLLELSADGAIVLSEQQVIGLKRITMKLGNGYVVSSPHILMYESQLASVTVAGSAGGRKVYFKSSDVTQDAAVVRFAAETARRGKSDQWDADRSWRMEGQQTLQVGQAAVQLGGADEEGNSVLVVVKLIGIEPSEAKGGD